MRLGDMMMSALDRLGPLPFTLEDMARFALPRLPAGRALADAEKETLRAMAEVLLDDCPVKVPLPEMVDRFETFLIQGKSKRGWRCRMLLTLVEYAPIVAYGRPVRTMSIEQRRRYVREKLMRGGFPWSTCAKVRYLAYAGAYSVPEADGATGFVPFAQRPRTSAAASAGVEVRREA
jgi:hypothetical protein